MAQKKIIVDFTPSPSANVDHYNAHLTQAPIPDQVIAIPAANPLHAEFIVDQQATSYAGRVYVTPVTAGNVAGTTKFAAFSVPAAVDNTPPAAVGEITLLVTDV